MASFTDIVGQLGGYYRDIEVARASNNGGGGTSVRPESVPDQTSTAVPDQAGPKPPANSQHVNVAGVTMSRGVLTGVALFLGGLVAVRVLK